MLKLFTHHRSVSAHRVRIALNCKGVAYESIFTGLDGAAADRQSFRRINPEGLIPALWVDDDLVISQSSAILEYLEERYPERPLLHGDIGQRARIRSFAQIAIADTHPLNNLRVLRYLRDEMDVAYDHRRAWFEHWLHAAFGPMESLLADQPAGEHSFCFSARPSLADVCLVPQISMAERYGVRLDAYPTLRRVYRACLSLAAFQAAAPDTQSDSHND
ncbi:maleylacetoacetate isomerase [Salinisphaera sp. Q1T1-3]|uniref:maleylacetoacetate isomerase n=1 Tax=Salinisphaera sp. Q1T1-3 TaxID=2321229 RepID=UPI000E70A3D3|nr:maleylacetoacetate isomerase [Salinisphaera sp. Q1T1-3]RJS92357.1 maleylacetoacetate isomerase [Salinisphaera sp. Q1T1-3]